MNERFLFRGKREDNGEWVEGFLSKSRGENKQLELCIDHEEKGVMCSSIVIPETVGQYTGLTDKNGKRIFEGDILRVITGNGWSCPKGTKVYYEVVFTEFNEECATWAEYIGFMAKREEDNLDSIHYIVNSHGAEVIGNIHDNPKLLQRSDEE